MSKDVVVLENNFKAVGDAVTGEKLLRAVMAGATVIKSYARLNASSGRPGLNVQTGELINSIQVVEGESSKDHAEADIGPEAIYGRIHELGGDIVPVNAAALHFEIDGKHFTSQKVHIAARPYLRPAVDEHKQEIIDAMGAQVEGEIKAVT